MRKITRLIEKDSQKLCGEWDGAKADIDSNGIFEAFSLRSTQAFGLSLSREIFDEKFEIVRFQEIPAPIKLETSENKTLQ